MSTIGKNIKKIRVVKKLSQAQFAELFNLARPSVGAYEEGRSEPKIDNVIQIARYFGISIDSLLTKELTINDLYKFDLRAKELTKPDTGEKDNASDHKINPETVLVPGDKHFEYIVQMNNKDFISSLPKIYIPGSTGAEFRAFEATNAEMYDQYQGINHGDYVIGKKVRKVEHKNFEIGKVYVMVLEKGIIVRRVAEKNGEIVLKGDNPNFQTMKIKMPEILEAWIVKGYFTKDIKQPSLMTDRLLTLENVIRGLERRIDIIEKK